MRLSDINGILRRLESTDQPPPRRYSADEHPVKGKIWGPGGACGRTGEGRGRRSNVAAAAPGRSAARRWGPEPGSALRQGGRPRGQRPEPAGAGAEGPRSGVRDGRGSGGPHEDPQWSRAGACGRRSADTRGHQARRRAASGRPRPSIDVYQGPCSGVRSMARLHLGYSKEMPRETFLKNATLYRWSEV